jgi:hypothetical protein
LVARKGRFMSLVVPNTADILMLQYIVNMIAQDGGAAPVGGERLLRLYTNNLTPGKNTVIGDITEATEAGYAAITLAGASWTTTSILGVNSATYSEQTFTFTAAVTAYGYYITTTEVTPNLLWVERFSDGPYTLPAGGGDIAITPRLTLN